MPIVGFSLESLGGEKQKKKPKGEIKVNSTPKIKNVEEVDVPAFKKKALAFSFEFKTVYQPDIAEINAEGKVLYLTENNQPILDKWKQDKKLPDEVSMEIINHLFQKCLVKMAELADDLQLPPPLQMPQVKPKQQQKGFEETGYIG